MSEFKGTPGKWPMTQAGDGKRYIIGAGLVDGPDGYEVAEVYADDAPYLETLANARLIAAAPDLLEALDWAIAEIEGRTRYEPNDIYEAEDQRENALDCARSAIAKALGQ